MTHTAMFRGGHVDSRRRWRRWRRHVPQPALSLLLALSVALAAMIACSGGDAGEGGSGDSTAVAAADAASGSGSAGSPGNGDDSGEDADDDGSDDKPRQERAVSVTAARVVRGDLVLPIIAEGTIRARRAAEIRTEIAGRIERVPVIEGDRVRAGQVILELDAREYQVAFDEARSRYLEALSRLAVEEGRLPGSEVNDPDAASGGSSPPDDSSASGTPSEDLTVRDRRIDEQLAELRLLERRGKISREERIRRQVQLELDAVLGGSYREEIASVRSGLAGAQAALERARLDLERVKVVAPFAGVISDLTLAPGEQLQPNQVVCRLVDNIDVEAEVGVLESDLRGIEVGRPALLALPALGDTLSATVDVVDPEVDRDSRTCRVLMRLRSEDGRIRPGMFVRAAIAGEILRDRLVVSREALLTREGRPLVFKVEDDQAKWLYVDVGARNDRQVEIVRVLQGGSLGEGDRVIVSNHLTLAHNAKVSVKKTLEPRDPWAGTTTP